MKAYSLFLISILTLLSIHAALAASCHADDEAGLLAFKSGINHDPSGMLSSWKPGTDCCQWVGINCLGTDRVNSISLNGQPDNSSSYLSGTISPSLAKLKKLGGIYFEDLKNITGQFPISLFGLPEILFIYIKNIGLSGQLPSNIGKLTQLQALSLHGNRFSGQIPSSISKLTGLTQLNLGNNFLIGSVPPGVAKLKNLTLLNLERNQLTGPIPNFFTSFNELRVLQFSHNKFTGSIPTSVSSLSQKLMYLELGHNSLSGQIPSFLGNFKSLDTLDLSSNHFYGTVPQTFKNLTKIFNLDLSHNSLTDPFPALEVKGIESLDLSYNQFHLNEIPKWVTSSPIIYSLKLAKCGLRTDLSNWKPTQTYFYDYIDLSDNAITGSPIWFLNNTDYLVEFKAAGNKLKFDMAKIRIVSTLKKLDLSRNSVYGKVPSSVAGLQSLNVSYNHMCGQLPATKFPASAFIGNDCLCGSPLAPCKF